MEWIVLRDTETFMLANHKQWWCAVRCMFQNLIAIPYKFARRWTLNAMNHEQWASVLNGFLEMKYEPEMGLYSINTFRLQLWVTSKFIANSMDSLNYYMFTATFLNSPNDFDCEFPNGNIILFPKLCDFFFLDILNVTVSPCYLPNEGNLIQDSGHRTT